MTLIGNAEEKLHVQCQVKDYTFRGNDFEDMGFLSFMVETYERCMIQRNMEDNIENNNIDESLQSNSELTINPNLRYMDNHPKLGTHYRVCHLENYNSLPNNTVGPWLP